jgi:hypothetical protein
MKYLFVTEPNDICLVNYHYSGTSLLTTPMGLTNLGQNFDVNIESCPPGRKVSIKWGGKGVGQQSDIQDTKMQCHDTMRKSQISKYNFMFGRSKFCYVVIHVSHDHTNAFHWAIKVAYDRQVDLDSCRQEGWLEVAFLPLCIKSYTTCNVHTLFKYN